MHERSWSQRFTGLKAAEMTAREHSELVIHEAEELVDGSGVALAPIRKRAIDLVIVAAH